MEEDVRKRLDEILKKVEKVEKNEKKIKILNDIIDRQQILIDKNIIELSILRDYISKNLDTK